MAGSPVARETACAFRSAFSSNVSPVSATSGASGKASRPTRSMSKFGVGQDSAHLDHLVLIAGGQNDASTHRPSASCCSRVSSAQPVDARSSSASSSDRSKGTPSAVPCTSMKRPSPVQTTFMSVSAVTSSS